MSFDDVLVKYLGQFGPYQAFQCILVLLPHVFTSLHSFSWTFTAAKMKHRCRYLGEENTSTSYEVDTDWLAHISNLTNDNSGCTRLSNTTVGQYILATPSNLIMEPCVDGYIWDYSDVTYSALNRWDLVCDRDIIRATIQSVYFIGQFFGSLILGMLSDRIGRRPVFLFSVILQVFSGIGIAFAPWWPLLAVLRTLLGFSHAGLCVITVVIAAELVGPKYRLGSGAGANMFFALGLTVLGALAYPLRDYRYLQLAISLPGIFLLSYHWLVPESARWLISRGKYEKADRILQRVAKFNGQKPLPPDWYSTIETEKGVQQMTCFQSVWALFRTPNLRQRTLISFLLYTVCIMCYAGLAMNPGFMGGDNRLGFIIGGILELPGLLIFIAALNVIGRKLMLFGGFQLAATCVLLTLAVPQNLRIISLLLVIIGKCALTIVLSTIYTITPELYPTIIRSTANGACSMVARAGGVAASFLALYLADRQPQVVAIFFGILSFTAGVAALFLPETTGEPLLETIEEAEASGNGQPMFLCGYKKLKWMMDTSNKKKRQTELQESSTLHI